MGPPLCCRELSAAAAITVTVAVFLTSGIRRCVDEGGYLELVSVSVCDIGEGFGEVDVLAAADIDGGGGLSAEFMRMPIRIIGGKLYFMDMRSALPDCLAGNRGKSVIMTFVAAPGNECASDYLVHMLRVEAFRGKAVVHFFHSDSYLPAVAGFPFRE